MSLLVKDNPKQIAELYERIGGSEGCLKIITTFYGHVASDQNIRPLFPGSFRCPIEFFTKYLEQILGGSTRYSESRGFLALWQSHDRFKFGLKERDAWISCMQQTMQEMPFNETDKKEFMQFFTAAAELLAHIKDNTLHCDEVDFEGGQTGLMKLWELQLNIDLLTYEITLGNVESIHKALKDEAIKCYFERNRPALATLLVSLANLNAPSLNEFINRTIENDPALLNVKYALGMTLLHGAAADWNVRFVEYLLNLGAKADGEMNTPLHNAANRFVKRELRQDGAGAETVSQLCKNGASVNAHGGIHNSSPLHHAARRGNLAVAEKLIEFGADLHYKNSRGHTALQRAINCGQIDVTKLLLSKGAKLEETQFFSHQAIDTLRNEQLKALLTTYL